VVTRSPNSNATGASRNSDPADAADRRFERQVLRLYTLGARAVCELLREVGVQTMHMTTIEQVLDRYACIDPDALTAFDGDRFAPRPLHLVRGGHNAAR
jgi:hypothetical protein